MNCSRIEAKMREKSYWVICMVGEFCSKIHNKINEANWVFWVKKAKIIKKEYWVKFCVRYRPVGMLEWILARGWWNDKWIWTEDWIFNDWKI